MQHGITVDLSAAAMSAFSESSTAMYSVTAGVARIDIAGILRSGFSPFPFMIGQTLTRYVDIEEALARAKADDSVNEVRMYISSPGGSVDGLTGAMDAIKDFDKPIEAVVGVEAASAAYALASQADKITARDDGSRFGSVGVVADAFVFPERVSVTNTASPDKRPDLATEEGQAVLRAQLDQVYDVMATRIAEGRGITLDEVNQKFGKGGVMVASAALQNGLIDAVGVSDTTAPAPEGTNNDDEGVEAMKTLEELKAQHPALYAQAVAAGVTQGEQNERARVEGHLALAAESGAMQVAIEAINAGTPAGDGATMAKHQTTMLASLKEQQITADSEDLGDIDNPPPAKAKDDTTTGMDAVADLLGYDGE